MIEPTRGAGGDVEGSLPLTGKDEKDLSIAHYEQAVEPSSVGYVQDPQAERRCVPIMTAQQGHS